MPTFRNLPIFIFNEFADFVNYSLRKVFHIYCRGSFLVFFWELGLCSLMLQLAIFRSSVRTMQQTFDKFINQFEKTVKLNKNSFNYSWNQCNFLGRKKM